MKTPTLIALVALAGASIAGAQTPRELQSQIVTLQKQIATLQSALVNVQRNPVLALAPFVTLDTGYRNGVRGPTIVFQGVNLQLINGAGSNGNGNGGTAITNGLGNLIIGYDETPVQPLNILIGNRSGSHNLILGYWNQWTAACSGAIISGYNNLVGARDASIIGGYSSGNYSGEGTIISGDVSYLNGGKVLIGGTGNSFTGYAPWGVLIGGGGINYAPESGGTSTKIPNLVSP
jgi:hypothetical protein